MSIPSNTNIDYLPMTKPSANQPEADISVSSTSIDFGDVTLFP